MIDPKTQWHLGRRHTSGTVDHNVASDCRWGRAAQEGITRGLEQGAQFADREGYYMAKKKPALFIPVKMG